MYIAGSRYQDKGIAILRRLNDGTISFQTGMSRRTQFVRATLYSISNGDTIKIGSSSVSGIRLDNNTNNDVESEIRNARNFLFEEELFHVMLHEARSLASHRVQVTDRKIVINMYDEILEIESIDYKSLSEEKRIQYSTRANLFCSVFRILLCNFHRRNLERRCQFPASIATHDHAKQNVANILRPLLAHVLHEKILKRTKKALELLTQSILEDVYPDGTISITQDIMEPQMFSSDNLSSSELKTQRQSINQQPLIGGISMDSTAYLGRLAVQPASTVTIAIPDKLVVIIKIGSPLQWHIPLYSAAAYIWPFSPENQKKPKSTNDFHDLSDLEEWVKWIFNSI